MQSVGEKLKQARIEQNLSLDEVYKQTKIHTHVLEALEQDLAHNLLSFVYIKGFLKTYAQFLGLDGEKLLKEYVDSQSAEPQTPAEKPKVKKEKAPLKFSPILILRVVVVFVLSLSFIFYFRYVAKTISRQAARPEFPKIKVEVLPAKEAAKERLDLQVRAKEDCWIKVVADDGVVFQQTLPKGRVERWQARKNLELRIGKPEAVDVLLNGKLIDLKKAKVQKGLVITQEGIVAK